MNYTATFNNNQDAIAVSQKLTEDHKVIDNTINFEQKPDIKALKLAANLKNISFEYSEYSISAKSHPGWQLRECLDDDAMAIYVACLAAYNHGYLHGMWIDCQQPVDNIRDDIEFMLSLSPVKHVEECEDWAIHDTNNWHGIEVSEHEDLDELSNIANAIFEHGDAYRAYLSNFDGDIEDFGDRYCGEYNSLEDFAYQYCEDTGMISDVPDNIKMYFDYAAFGRDMDLNGDIAFIDGHVFYCH